MGESLILPKSLEPEFKAIASYLLGKMRSLINQGQDH
jgi:hypothetical protein